MTTIISNVVSGKALREVQTETTKFLSECLKPSFGPMGSYTEIAKKNAYPEYTKDGHTILSGINFVQVIEEAVRAEFENITRHIVKTVGDGTTSAVILSDIIFRALTTLEADKKPIEIIREFKSAVELIKSEIQTKAIDFTPEAAYNIAMISTNGNAEVSTQIKNIYTQYGNDVFVDVSASVNETSYLKTYDGMTLETGYTDTAYINHPKNATCVLRKPQIFTFEDPIDTEEMMSFFAAIVTQNIFAPLQDPTRQTPLVPTVIMCPKVSRDLGSIIEELVSYMYSQKEENRPPFLLITNVTQRDQFMDIAKLSGCKNIRKYIDPKKQDADIAAGLAPTPETIFTFAGTAEEVVADASVTKFINPLLMKDEEGNYTDTFNNLLIALQSELDGAVRAGEDANVTGTLKRRINSLKANMVEYIVGGISVADRDSVRALVEDAVLNCRSAAKNGFGYGANFEGLRASVKLANENPSNASLQCIKTAYFNLLNILYGTCYSVEDACAKVEDSLEKGMPINLSTNEFDGLVLCSIATDKVILDAIAKIVTIMFTSNQFLCPTPFENKYTTL